MRHGAARRAAKVLCPRRQPAGPFRVEASRIPRLAEREPSDARAQQDHRHRIVHDLARQVAEELASAAVACVIDHLIDQLAGRRASPKLLERVIDTHPRFFGFLLKLRAGFHRETSIGGVQAKRCAAHVRWCGLV